MIKIILFIFFILCSSLVFAQELCRDGKKNCILEKGFKQKSKTIPSMRMNFYGQNLKVCSLDPRTGFYRDGTCRSDSDDRGNHSVCAVLTKDFLAFTRSEGNDLSTPNPRYNFPGLKPGDRWCLCAARWLEAKREGIELNVDFEASSRRAFHVTNEFDFAWKNRIVKCSSDLEVKQVKELLKDRKLSRDLKLLVVRTNKLESKCQLFGLDGSIKIENNRIFQLPELEKIINQMPIRQEELQKAIDISSGTPKQ